MNDPFVGGGTDSSRAPTQDVAAPAPDVITAVSDTATAAPTVTTTAEHPTLAQDHPAAAFDMAAATPLPSSAFIPVPAAPSQSDAPTVRLLVAVGWEGRDLRRHNLEALASARAAHPDVPFTHFLSPAYFLRAGVDPTAARAAVAAALQPDDRIGLELGGWKSLAAAAGVIFRSAPTFFGQKLHASTCADDCGGEVPINVYPKEDAANLATTALDTLAKHGFGTPDGARVSGWVASPHVLEALAERGIRYDFSAVPPELLQKRIGAFPLHDWVRALWAGVTPQAQPFVPPKLARAVTVIPQNVASLDYTSEAEVIAVFTALLEAAKKDPTKELTFQLGAYQETARMTAPRLARVIGRLKALAKNASVTLLPLEVGAVWSGSSTVAH